MSDTDIETKHMNYKGLIPRSKASRFEGLGINCEFGFVIRQLGYEIGSLFRWTGAPTKNVVSALRSDFDHMYDYKNLVPQRGNFVRDTKFDVGWHTEMHTFDNCGSFEFVQEYDERIRIWRSERRKVNYLVRKFLTRIRAGGVIYIVKSNIGLDPNLLSSLRQELLRLSQGSPFWIADVKLTSDQTLLGQVIRINDNVFEAYISDCGTFETTSQPQMRYWVPIIDKLLEMAPCKEWEQIDLATEKMLSRGTLDIGFPSKVEVSSGGRYMADLGGGKVDIINPNPWTRLCGNNFRIHASQPGHPETGLRWFDIELSGKYTLLMEICSPVRGSLDVDVKVIVATKTGRTLAEENLLITSGKKIHADLDFVATSGESLTIELLASAQRSVGRGERAVVDITPVSLVPA